MFIETNRIATKVPAFELDNMSRAVLVAMQIRLKPLTNEDDSIGDFALDDYLDTLLAVLLYHHHYSFITNKLNTSI